MPDEFRVVVKKPYPNNLPEDWEQFIVGCNNCSHSMMLQFSGFHPDAFNCPHCGYEIVIYKCLHCNVRHEEGKDQAFISVDLPDGSSVWDCMFGPAYFCSSAHLVEAFKSDDFNAKGMWE